jgi:glutamate racemase
VREAPIGVFDSGVGGLTVLKALAAELPHEHFVYLGDTARLPYGTKSPETVARYALQAAEALCEYGVKCLVIACNTASSVGLPAIRAHIQGVPIIGVIEPGAEAACAASRSGHIAVIATEGTVRGGAYQEAILRLRSRARVVAQPTQLFVALAEEGLHQGPIADSIARHYLDPLFRDPSSFPDSRLSPGPGFSPDTLVLGCTHFPMLAGAIRAAVGPDIQIVDSAATTAKSVRETLERESLTRPESPTARDALAARKALAAHDAPTGREALAAHDASMGRDGLAAHDAPTGREALAAHDASMGRDGLAARDALTANDAFAARDAVTNHKGATRFLATDSIERFARIGSRFLERPIHPEEVELVDL